MNQDTFQLINQEVKRQKNGLELIPSENYVSKEVLEALGSILTNKYSEGYPGKRYYGGNEFVDEIEKEAQRLANQLFGTAHANVQPYSGSPANLEVDLALAKPGDTIMGMSLTSGGHLTHGASASYTGKIFNAIQYGVSEDGRIDFEQVKKLAGKHKPKVIWAGITAYPYQLDFGQFGHIAESVGAYLVADISHIAGLIVAGEHPSPTPFVDIITTTTHKTLRGPRGAIILVTEKGLKKDPDLAEKIDKSVFPGMQGGPHNHQTAAIAIALQQASKEEFKSYIKQVVNNAKVLASELDTKSENHMLLLNLNSYGYGMGYQAQIALETSNITVNKNTVPGEAVSPFYPSGIRLGTPAVTSRGMKEVEMRQIAQFLKEVLQNIKGYDLPKDLEKRAEFIKDYRIWANENEELKKIKQEVEEFAKKFPVPGVDL